MIPPGEFESLLWHELRAAKLTLTPARYAACRAEITRLGEVERDRIVSLLGETAWRRVLTEWGTTYPEGDCVRVLGFGHALTEFAVAPLQLPEAEREAVVGLGALANFVVATYDHLVDRGKDRWTLLPRWQVRLAAHDQGRPLLSVLGCLAPNAMTKLVVSYFRRLEQPPFSTRHAHVHKLIQRTVVRMYDAESETLKAPGKLCSKRTLQRKAALPFVAMGLPAWMATPTICRRRYRWHLRWLYRLGLFFGWVDDAIDLKEDSAAGRPNLFSETWAHCRYSNADTAALARRITHGGVRILDEWHLQIGEGRELPSVATEAFSACLVSWFGGTARLL